jgi:hypothetical protein
MGLNLKQFASAFTVVFAISFLCWFAGHNAYIAATPDKLASPDNPNGFPISQSLGLTGEAGYIIALIVGLVIGNFFSATAKWLAEAARSCGQQLGVLGNLAP